MDKPRWLGQVRDALRVRHYSLRTEATYIQWIKRFILFHNKRHPLEMGEREIAAFLTHLSVNQHVAPSTQNQALSAILFLYQDVLEQELDWMDDIVRAKRAERVPRASRHCTIKTSAKVWGAYICCSGIARPRGREDNHDLHVCPATRWTRRDESIG